MKRKDVDVFGWNGPLGWAFWKGSPVELNLARILGYFNGEMPVWYRKGWRVWSVGMIFCAQKGSLLLCSWLRWFFRGEVKIFVDDFCMQRFGRV